MLLIGLLCKIQEFIDSLLSDDEVYDASWMDYKAWKETRV